MSPQAETEPVQPAVAAEPSTDAPMAELATIIDFLRGRSTDLGAFAAACVAVIRYGLGVFLESAPSGQVAHGNAPRTLNISSNAEAAARLESLLPKMNAAEAGEDAPPAVNKVDWKSILGVVIPFFLKFLV